LHDCTQRPEEHTALPFTGTEHAIPQPPQCIVLVAKLASQPLSSTPSQLPKPALQALNEQRPDVHTADALAKEQTLPQAPQCEVLVVRLVSHPLPTLPSQLPKPVLQVIPHMPLVQVAVPLLPLHTLPQAPQWVGEDERLVSQPLAALPSQLPKPELQTKPQLPRVQRGIALACAGQTLPHAPQFDGSVCRSTQRPEQKVVGATQRFVHMRDEHTWPTMQARPQAPQWAFETARLTSQPLAGLPSQSAKSVLHAPTAHAPLTHTAVALGRVHAPPQRPQCATLVRRSTSQPLAGLPSQSPKPALHAATTQPPAAHAAVALGSTQALPHTPQCEVLVVRLVSHPLAALPSQLPKPALQVIPHMPLVQVAVPLLALHTLPQAPQWVGEDERSVSQPLETTPSQLPRPGLHEATVHAPATQAGVALGREHIRPQPPQWLAVALVLVSQPLAALPSQLPKPALQVIPHTPPVQVAVPLLALHTLPQAPQWVGEDERLVSQPLAALPSQLPKPALQAARVHTPAAHTAVALAKEQALPQRPQWEGLLRRSTQAEPHAV
jgi:hypothetical protein